MDNPYEDALADMDVDQNNPVDLTADDWLDCYMKNPEAYDNIDWDCLMN